MFNTSHLMARDDTVRRERSLRIVTEIVLQRVLRCIALCLTNHEKISISAEAGKCISQQAIRGMLQKFWEEIEIILGKTYKATTYHLTCEQSHSWLG